MGVNVKYGVGVVVLDEEKILLGHRNIEAKDTGGIYEPDSWTLPGGKQEYDESVFECAIRETKEETNLDILEEDLELFSTENDIQKDKHFLTSHVLAHKYSGELKVMEPDKIDEWKWFNLESLPENIYSPSKKEIDSYIKKKVLK